jgi:hypothetical protein
MNFGGMTTLGSIEAIRPVFWMVMGVFIFLYAWRLARRSSGWTARFLVAGALLLAFGYSFVLPMYEAGVLERFAEQRRHYHGSAATALAWNVVKITVMNFGWLVFGTGIALHAGLIRLPVRKPQPVPAASPIAMHNTPRPSHELAA